MNPPKNKYLVDPDEDFQKINHYFLPVDIQSDVKDDEEEANISYGDKILNHSYVHAYITDAITLLHQEFQTSKPEEIEPIQFTQHYLKSVVKGTHVLGRNYSFIKATSWNKICFAKQIYEAFRHLDPNHEISGADFYELICLLCSDFPRCIVNVALVTAYGKHEGEIKVPEKVPFGKATTSLRAWLVLESIFKSCCACLEEADQKESKLKEEEKQKDSNDPKYNPTASLWHCKLDLQKVLQLIWTELSIAGSGKYNVGSSYNELLEFGNKKTPLLETLVVICSILSNQAKKSPSMTAWQFFHVIALSPLVENHILKIQFEP